MSAIDVEVIGTDQIIEITESGDHEVEVEAEVSVNGGSKDYDDLSHKPRIEGVELEGDKSFDDLNLNKISNSEIEELLSLSF